MSPVSRSSLAAAVRAVARRLASAGAPVRSARHALALLLGVVLAMAGCAERVTDPAVPAPASAPRRLIVSVPADPYTFTQVSAGWWNTCAVRTGGGVLCWGNEYHGLTEVPEAVRSGATQVSLGERHACALAGGAVTCWGADDYEQSTVPEAARSGVTQVSVGQVHSCALAGGAVTCWGARGGSSAVVPEVARSGVTHISAGINNTCAVVGAAGTVSCWGDDTFGQSTPPADLSGVTQVSASTHHGCARRTDGTVVCWGTFASPLTGLSAVTQVSTGLFHACAVGSDAAGSGAVACWGDDSREQSTVPTAARTGGVQVSTRYLHSCALSTAGTIVCWGENDSGQATVPTPPSTTTRVLPTATFTAPTSVVAGQPVALALTDVRVPGHPQATTFTYAFDCGSGTYAASAGNSASCPTSAAGTLDVRGRVTDQDGDTASYGATVTVTAAPVVRAPQTLSFTSTPAAPAYVGATYVPVAVSSAGLPVTVTLDAGSTGVCTLASGTVTFSAAGTCTIAADQAGNATFAPAERVTQAITIVQRPAVVLRPQTIQVTTTLPASAVVTRTFTLAATGGASGQPVVFASQTPATCTTTGNRGTKLTLVAPGACAVQVTQAGDATYAPATPVALGLAVLSAAEGVAAVRAIVAGSSVPADVRQGLTNNLDAAAAALAAGDRTGACSALGAFRKLVQTQRGKAIPRETADAWLGEAAQLRRAVGC
jgi:hypothetical protein